MPFGGFRALVQTPSKRGRIRCGIPPPARPAAGSAWAGGAAADAGSSGLVVNERPTGQAGSWCLRILVARPVAVDF